MYKVYYFFYFNSDVMINTNEIGNTFHAMQQLLM